MSLSKQETSELKAQLKEQIQHLPPEKKAQAEEQINSMSDEAIEEMLSQQQSSSQKIFRMIVSKEIPSVQIGENSSAIAVLSTKSISKGHTIIIPKSPIEKESEIPKELHSFSEEISKKLISSLNAKSTNVLPEKAFGELILDVIPIYDSSLNLQSPRKNMAVEELEKLKIEINVEKIKKEPEKIKLKKPRKSKVIKLKRRIP